MKTNQYINGVEGIYIILSQVRFMAQGQRSEIPQLMNPQEISSKILTMNLEGERSTAPNYDSMGICMQG